jgi:acyl carrier protein
MSTTDIASEVHTFVITNFLFGQPLELQPGDSLLENGVIDSTGILELVAFLGERYSITVEDEELTPQNLDSVHNIAIFVEGKLSSRNSGS